jgi:phytoene desaturase
VLDHIAPDALQRDKVSKHVGDDDTHRSDAGRSDGGAGHRPTAVIIGGGFGGIAAALRLRALGYETTLIERLAHLGGRAQVFEIDGFKHDAGPTVLTAPFLFDELFELFGKRTADYLTLLPLKPWYRFHFNDGSSFDYGGSQQDILSEIARVSPRDVPGYQNLIRHSRSVFDIAFRELSHQPFHHLRKMLDQIPLLLRLRADRSVWSLVSKHIAHPNLRQALSIQPLLIGGNPFETTSIYSLIHYLEQQWGVYYAVGGTGAVVSALTRLMQEQGVNIRHGTTVKRLVLEGRTARGVELESGERIMSDVIVSNADPMHLYRHMVDGRALSAATRLKLRSSLSMGLFVMYFGTRRQYPSIARHTIWMGARYRELLADIFHGRDLPNDFSLYIHRPTATDPSFAPDGCDSFYVLCPVPNASSNIDWSSATSELRARVIAALERTIMPGLSSAITAERTMNPNDFHSDYLSYCGTGFSVAPRFTQSAWFRFHNRSESVANLFLVGAGTHPGAGIPGVLCSAKVVETLVRQQMTAGATPYTQRARG